jgi:hypothetical protein
LPEETSWAGVVKETTENPLPGLRSKDAHDKEASKDSRHPEFDQAGPKPGRKST